MWHAWECRKWYKVLVGNPDGKGPLRRLKRRWEDNIKIDLKDSCWESVEWIHLVQDWGQWQALVNTFRFWHHGVSY
jgi:hypothetical protein